MGSQLRVVGNALLNIAADLGQALFPAVKSAAEFLTNLAATIRVATSDTNSFANTLFQFSAATGVAVGAIGTLAVAVGGLITLLGAPLVAKIALVTAALAAMAGAAFAFRDDIHAAFVGIGPVLDEAAADFGGTAGLLAGLSSVAEDLKPIMEGLGGAIAAVGDRLISMIPGLSTAIALFQTLRARGQEVIAQQTIQEAATENLAKQTANMSAEGLRMADAQGQAKEASDRLKKVMEAVNAAMKNFRPVIKDVTGETENAARATDGLTVAQRIAATAAERLFQAEFDLESKTRELTVAMQDVQAPIINVAAELLKTAEGAKQFADDILSVSTLAGDSIASIQSKIAPVANAFASLRSKSTRELQQMAAEADQNFKAILRSGIANAEQLREAEINSLEARKAVAQAVGQELTASEAARLAELTALQEGQLQESVGLFEDWAAGVESVVESLGADLFRGLFSGGFDNDSIKRKLRTIVDSFRDAFVSPVTKLFSGLATGIGKTLDSLLSGRGTGGLVNNLFGGGGPLGNIIGGLFGGGGIASAATGGFAGGAGAGALIPGIGSSAATFGALQASGGLFTGGAATAGTAGGGGFLGGLGGTLAPLVSNPIGIAVLGSIAAGFAAKSIFSTGTIDKFRNEFERDFGGVELPKDFVKGLLASFDISKQQLETDP